MTRYFEQHPTDLVLLDADHDQISWTIFYRKIKSINSTSKVVLMSANDKAAVRAHEIGVWDYQLKPVKKKQI
ncbi:MAG: hypothetical protein M0T74_03490 [Desulfitobacterium hafniense]|nr:hypothetical protein [Desulfitobacterium hafniense]